MPNSFIWRGTEPKTKFAGRIYAPIYVASDGTSDFNSRLIDYILECEKVLEKEEIVSELFKGKDDPYRFTQHWKQHNLIDDTISRKDGDHLKKFPVNDITKELFNKIRTNYLLFLSEMKFPRIKVWMHTWANVIRDNENISFHSHIPNETGYLASVYYPKTSPTQLYLVNPINSDEKLAIKTQENKIVFFPSWMIHGSDMYHGSDTRISVASDIVIEETVINNPWRPHILLDDPATMPGL